jgi:hypothetical protein
MTKFKGHEYDLRHYITDRKLTGYLSTPPEKENLLWTLLLFFIGFCILAASSYFGFFFVKSLPI